MNEELSIPQTMPQTTVRQAQIWLNSATECGPDCPVCRPYRERRLDEFDLGAFFGASLEHRQDEHDLMRFDGESPAHV